MSVKPFQDISAPSDSVASSTDNPENKMNKIFPSKDSHLEELIS